MTYPNYSKNGIQFNYMLLSATAPKIGNMIFWQGSGEWGPLDGSQIQKCIAHEYPKLAANGTFKFPFDILVLQGVASNTVQKVQNWQACEAGLFDLMDQLNMPTAIMAGLSQGGQQTLKYGYKIMNPDRRITALIVAGAAQPWGSKFPWLSAEQSKAKDYSLLQDILLDIPIIAVHGDCDYSGNSLHELINYLTPISNIPGRVNKPMNDLVTIKGGDHSDSWMKGFNPNEMMYGKIVWNKLMATLAIPEPEPVIEAATVTIRNGNEVYFETATGWYKGGTVTKV